MRIGQYRLTVVGCALTWLLVGMHFPVLHQMTHEGHSPDWLVVALTALLAAVGVAGVWVLLRVPGLQDRGPDARGPAA